ncbi:hypothetical protein [Nocardiopsis dassonvillei]|uniref:hypothetical protein n=1 Tax=Nocardiopsis dassonvillei TaxID=2014 RepID=UPI00157D6D5B|nr:hypothetical protein [Nocardiopsis dassonvillei]
MGSGSFGPRVLRPGGRTRPRLPWSSTVLDAVYLLGALAVFALVGVIGRGVEKL